MKKFTLNTLFLACASTVLVGCGDSETKITEIAPTVIPVAEDDHDHDHEGELSKGRLAIADAEHALVHIFDLDENSLVESVALTNPAEYLYASPENRYAVAVQRSLDTIEFIDGGVWQELHGDHYDQHEDAPMLTSFTLHDSKPTHYAPRGEHAAIFFDGNKETGDNASLSILSDESITAEQVIAEHHFDTYIHGTAEVRGDYVLTTLRDSDSESSLPNQIALLEVHGDHFHQEQVFDTLCPELHGSFQNETHIAFACADGILAFEQQGDIFTPHKIDNPVDMPEGVRIGSLKGSAESPIMIGSARGSLYLVDLSTESITPFNWQTDDTVMSVSSGFDGHNEHMLILDNTGHLNVFSAESDWQLEEQIDVFDTLANDAEATIIASRNKEVVYIIHDQEVTIVDLHEGEVTSHFDIEFTPANAAWLGVPTEEHEH